MKKSPLAYSSVILLVITIISVVVYFNSLPNPFHFDDEYYVTGNTYIRELSNIKEAFLQPKMLVRFGCVEFQFYSPPVKYSLLALRKNRRGLPKKG